MAARSDYNTVNYSTPVVNEVTTAVTTDVPVRRISWGAILAGLTVSLVAMIGLNMLGLAIGAATVNPRLDADPITPALGTGAAIWILGSNIISLFLGGIVAGRMAGMSDNIDAMLHGIVQWGLAFLLTVVLLTSSIGNVFGAVTNAVSSSLTAVGQGLTAISPVVADAVELEQASLAGVGVEVRNLLNRVAEAAGAETTAPAGTDTTAAAATLSEIEVTRAITALLTNPNPTDADRDAAVTLLSERAGISTQEARTTIERWETAVVQFRSDAERTVREVGQQVTDAIAALAGVVFVSMLVAAFAAGAGGIIGSPDPRVVVAKQVRVE
jgi:hypothetical protein